MGQGRGATADVGTLPGAGFSPVPNPVGAIPRLDRVAVFRVETPGFERVHLGKAGQIEIPFVGTGRGERALYVTLGNERRAREIARTFKGRAPEISAFDVPRETLHFLRRTAVPHRFGKHAEFSSRAQISDPSKGRDQFGLKSLQIEMLRQAAIPGTGRLIK